LVLPVPGCHRRELGSLHILEELGDEELEDGRKVYRKTKGLEDDDGLT
jgi:hypothetical protein